MEKRKRISSLQKIENLLRQELEYLLETYHVQKIGVFGSYARQSANPDSDVDLLIEFSEPIGWEIVDLSDFLEGLLGRKVDLVTSLGLKPQIKDSILQQVVYILVDLFNSSSMILLPSVFHRFKMNYAK